VFPIYKRKVIDLLSFYRRMNPRSFQSAMKEYCSQDVPSTIKNSSEYLEMSVDLFNNMLSKHMGQKVEDEDVPVEVVDDFTILSKLFNPKIDALDSRGNILINKTNRPIFNFGKHKGKVIIDIANEDPNYIDWLSNAKDISKETVELIKSIISKARALEAEKKKVVSEEKNQ
jgi:DNA polymerase-3 subunit epsilon